MTRSRPFHRATAREHLAVLLLVALATGCGSDGAPAHGAPDAGVTPQSEAGTGGVSGSGGESGTGGSVDGSGGTATLDAGHVISGDASPELDGALPPVLTEAGALPEFVCDGAGARYATYVYAHEFGPGQDFNQDLFPKPLFGPPKGAGLCNGGMDVVSLGNGGTVTLGFAGNGIVDGPGPDFTVFENAFGIECDPNNPFAELATVAVSDDGVTWHEYPCTAKKAPFGQCSGARPVIANPDENDVDPLDPAVSGGDAYDLADLGLARARLVRITDRPDLTGTAGVYDLDAVAILNPACP